MKNRILFLLSILMIIPLVSCNYNGSANIIVKNIGSLTIVAQVEYTQITIGPGGENKFKIKWPGHDDMHINLITYPTAYKNSMGGSISIWLKNGEDQTYEIEYYPPVE